MNDYKLSDKLKYWLDKQLSKGTASIIKLLSICVISIVIFVSVVIVLFKLRDGFLEAFWDSLATIVNAWMPSSEDGEAGYIVLNTITAIVGLFFTSILIGVISSGIEAKLDAIGDKLKKKEFNIPTDLIGGILFLVFGIVMLIALIPMIKGVQ